MILLLEFRTHEIYFKLAAFCLLIALILYLHLFLLTLKTLALNLINIKLRSIQQLSDCISGLLYMCGYACVFSLGEANYCLLKSIEIIFMCRFTSNLKYN